MIGRIRTSGDSNEAHPAFSRVFAPGHLAFGLIAPLEGYPNLMAPTMQDHVDLARQADVAGFSAIWLRDVPLLDPEFEGKGDGSNFRIKESVRAAVLALSRIFTR